MNKNMNSPTKLTEFAPLSPEESPPVVASFLSKIFSFTKGSGSSSAATSSPTEEKNLSTKTPDKTPDDDRSSVMNFPIDSTEGRSLPNVLKRISNIVAIKGSNLQSYEDTQLRSYWMPDSVSKQCYECGERFTTFRRRHHCRVCGQIFCSKCCCDEIPGKIMGCTGDLRVCTYCCKVVLSYLQSLDMRSDLTADLKALQEDLEVKYGSDSPPVSEKCNDDSVQNETLASRKSSVGYMEEKYAIGRSTNSYLSMQERALALQNSASLRMIYEELFRSSKAIMLQTHRIRLKSYQNCFMGSDLINWVIAQNIAATRVQAVAIGQALLEAGFIESILSDTPFSDSAAIFKPVKVNFQNIDFLSENQTNCDLQEPAWVKNIPQHDSTTDSESESKQVQVQSTGRLPSSSSSFYLDLNLESSVVTLKRPQSEDLTAISIDSNDGLMDDMNEDFIKQYQIESDQKVSDELLNDSLQVEELGGRNGWHKVKNLRNTYGEAAAYNQLISAYKRHEDSLVKQLLIKEGVSLNWSETIIQIANQIVDHVRPNLYHDADDADIRHYVQIKKSPGGSRTDCEIVSGVVCSKNVAHRGMNAMIANPKILLLRCGLMYQRTEGKLLSLEPVMMQENEYLGHTVARITALGPDVVLVHRSVSRLAQDRLRDNGVTLVLNVKLSVLERVARCTGANIVDTVDAHISARFKLGTCKKFYLRQFPGEKHTLKTLMFFEGCANPHLGSTILLRGGPQTELRKVKNVVFNMIFASYSWRLEKSFLMDEFAKPPSPKDSSFLDDTFRETSPKKEDSGEFSPNEIMSDKSTEKIERVLDPDSFKPVSEVLSESESVYDTLKLFRPKSHDENSKCSNTDEMNKNLESFGGSDSNQKGIVRDRLMSDEKRVHGESISDCSDPLQSYLNEEDDMDHGNISPNGQLLSVVQDLPLMNKFKKALEDTILSVSPYLKFTIPYLETEAGRNCVLRQFFPKDIYYSEYFLEKVDDNRPEKIVESAQSAQNLLDNVQLKSQHSFVQMKITSKTMDSKDIQSALAHFRACGSRLEKTNNILVSKKHKQVRQNDIEDNEPRWPDCLDLSIHQRLPVLFCSFLHSTNDAPAFCVNPWIVNMDLYGRNDIALGKFLEKYCLTTGYKCPAQNCRAQIAQHERRFVHDGGCIYINLTNLNSETFSGENSDQIMMWSKCMKCKTVSPVTPISDDTWSLSFAKYLELRFYAGVYSRRDTDICEHSLHHDHVQYFSKKNMLATFKHTAISQWEISLPPPYILTKYNPKQHSNVIEEIKSLTLKGEEVFSLVREKLSTFQLDLDTLNTLKQSLTKEQQYFKTKIEQIQLKLTSPVKEKSGSTEQQTQIMMHRVDDGIVLLKRLISEAVVSWNAKILEISSKKRDEKVRKVSDKTQIENESYIEDTVESQVEDLSPVLADYNAVEAIHSVIASESQQGEVVEVSDSDTVNPDEIIVVQGSPKIQQKIIDTVANLEEFGDKKKKRKTILSTLLPSTATTNPIPNMLGPMEHHLLPLGSVVPIVVYESEPSSIVAYALDSLDYKHSLQDLLPSKNIDINPSPLTKMKFSDNKDDQSEIQQSGEFKKPYVLSFLRGNSPNPASPVDTTEKKIVGTESGKENTSVNTEMEEEKKSVKQQHYIEVQFNDATTDFYCRIYFPVQFAALRKNVLPCGEDGFTRSLSRSVQWAARGGKSGSTFCKTQDDRFILKEMNRLDTQIFLEFAPNYFAYMEKCQQTKQPTLLGKIVGVYRVSYKNNTTNAALRTSVLVMENLFYNRLITDKFDLKGSMRNRLVNLDTIDREGEIVLLDENLLNRSCDSPLYVRHHSKAVLNKAIEEDTKFLADNHVMDYSLLVGLEPESDELVLGIIDYLRTFTWDKKLETMVKKSGIFGGQGKLPTIVSPAEYRDRFIAAMHRYFLPVPDRWMGLGRGVIAP